jgi:radical SAM protein with 4Fe4S-binding SPASM domain
VNRHVPNAQINLVTNGTALTPANVSKLTSLQNLLLNISLHEYRKAEYEALTKLSFERVTANLDALHQRRASGEVAFTVSVSRSGDGTAHDFLFLDWLRERYPLFQVGFAEQADWIGQVDVNVPIVPKVGCTHWFELVVRADGTVPLCCADGKGEYQIGDVHKQSLLEIYNAPAYRYLRASATSRLEREPCSRCTKVE